MVLCFRRYQVKKGEKDYEEKYNKRAERCEKGDNKEGKHRGKEEK